MKDLSKKLDHVLEKAGLSNRYQIIFVLLFIFQFTFCEYLNVAVPYLDDLPFVFFPYEVESKLLKFDDCKKNKSNKFDIDYSKTFISLVIKLNIFCDENKVNFIEIGYLISNILGAFFTFFFADLLGRKKTLIMLIPANIILYFLFGFCIIANYYFMMLILIISGFFNYIIMITMIIYICEIVEHESIPIFICLLVSGLPISGMFTYFFYNIKIKNWQKITIYLAIADIFIYLLILLFIIESPIYNLLNGQINSFKENLIKLSKINKKNIFNDDFDFILNFHKISNFSVEKKQINNIENDKENDNIINDDENDDFLKPQSNSSSISEAKMEIIDEKNPLSKIVFGKFKMKDYTPLHLLRSKEQIINFLILSYLWTACLIIKDGINYHKKSFLSYMDHIITLMSYIFDFIGYFIILLFFINGKLLVQPILVGLQLLSFIVLSFSIIERNIKKEMILFYISEVCWNCLYLLLYIITTIIYPSIIRTKGLSINKGLGKFGTLMGPLYFRQNTNENKDLILYHLVFALFSIILSYGLPQKIDFLIFENNTKENEDKNTGEDDENYEEKYKKNMEEKEENQIKPMSEV